MSHSAITSSVADDHVATVEMCRPPNNFFSMEIIGGIADAVEQLDVDDRCRAIVLRAQGKHFCAGADFGGERSYTAEELYATAVRIFRGTKPIVAAVQGAAIGGGLGLALVTDFRVASPEARFSANFARLGFHQGFGLSVTLPRLVGEQAAADLLYTGRRVGGEEALALGLADRLVAIDELHDATHSLALEIARSAPLAVRSIRATLRGDLADRVAAATAHEAAEQARLQATDDFAEGTRAMGARRLPNFTGR